MINFSTLQSLIIPEGNVTKIESGGVVLWENYKPAYAAIYGGDTLVFGRGANAPTSHEGMSLTAAFDSVNGYNVETDLYGFDQDWETYTMPWYNYRSSIASVKFIAKVAPIRTSYWFMGLSNCTSWELANLNTSNVEYMAQMFASTGGLAEDDLLNLNTSKVKNMYGLFQGTSAVSLDLSTWNTSNCTSFGSMFADTYDLKNLDLSGWDTTKATDMSYMFAYGNALESITLGANWSFTGDGSTNCELPDGNWKHVETSNMYAAADLAAGYDGSTLIGTYEKQLPPAYAAVYGGDTLVFGRGESVPENYNSKSLTESWRGIEELEAVSPTLIPWWNNYRTAITNVVVVDIIKPKRTAYWFYNMSACTNMDLKLVNTTKVTNMSYMFHQCKSLTALDVSNFNTAKVTSMYKMFYECSNLTSLDVSNFNTTNVTDMYGMFEGCSSLTSLDVSNFDTAKVTSMYRMFYNCSKLTSLDVSSFNTANVTTMSRMFYRCTSLTALDTSNFNTAKVTNMSDMFVYCSKLTTLDLSNFNTTNVTNMSNMFYQCSSLTTIYASSLWSTTTVTSSSNMFYRCSKLKGDIAFNSSYVDKAYAKTNGGYLTYKAAS